VSKERLSKLQKTILKSISEIQNRISTPTPLKVVYYMCAEEFKCPSVDSETYRKQSVSGTHRIGYEDFLYAGLTEKNPCDSQKFRASFSRTIKNLTEKELVKLNFIVKYNLPDRIIKCIDLTDKGKQALKVNNKY